MCLCVCVAGPCLTRTNPYYTHSHTARARASATVNEAFRPEVILAALAMAQSFSSPAQPRNQTQSLFLSDWLSCELN